MLRFRFVPQPYWCEVFAEIRAGPPSAFAWFGEAVAVPICSNKFRRRIGKGVARQQAKNSLFVLEKSLHEREQPRMKL